MMTKSAKIVRQAFEYQAEGAELVIRLSSVNLIFSR